MRRLCPLVMLFFSYFPRKKKTARGAPQVKNCLFLFESPQATNDRDLLLVLYRSTGGGNWKNKTNWGTDADLATWHGVEVNAQGRVLGLNLSRNNLRGIFIFSLAIGQCTEPKTTTIFIRHCSTTEENEAENVPP